MEFFEDAWSKTGLPQDTVGTVGNFDGIHRGQQAVIDLVTARARERGLRSVVVTFAPHPLQIIDPSQAPLLLSTRERKAEMLERRGIDALVEVAFTPNFSRTPARRFVRELLHEKLGMKEVYVGAGFTFGHRREGDLSLLRAMGKDFGFDAFAVDPVRHEGAPISSTRIRELLSAGEVAEGAVMLGRPYCLTGIVVRGAQRGRTLGWPTINLAPDNDLIPTDGVYVGRVRLGGAGEWLPSVVNIGKRPTFEDEMERVIVGHILDFDADLYGTRVEFGLLERLRLERAFDGIEALKEQIAVDALAAREYFRTSDGYPVSMRSNKPSRRTF
jgi:riboflavin kinase/FMN adenylyltransferase